MASRDDKKTIRKLNWVAVVFLSYPPCKKDPSMRKTPIQLAAFVIILFLSQFSHSDQFKSTGTVDVYFSPNGGATNAIVTELNNAKTEILVQAYSFTSAPIAKALTDARRDIVVYIEMFYNSNRRHSYLDYLSPKEFEELWLLEKAA